MRLVPYTLLLHSGINVLLTTDSVDRAGDRSLHGMYSMLLQPLLEDLVTDLQSQHRPMDMCCLDV